MTNFIAFLNSILNSYFVADDFKHDDKCLILKNGNFKKRTVIVFNDGTQIGIENNTIYAFDLLDYSDIDVLNIDTSPYNIAFHDNF